MPSRKAQISEITRLEIIELRGSKKANEVAELFGVKKNLVKQIWFRAEHPVIRGAVKDTRAPRAPQAPVLPDDDPIVDHGVTFMELGEEHCRWPIGKDHDDAVMFCGCDRLLSSAYEIRNQQNTKSAPRFKSFYCRVHYTASLSIITPEQRARIGAVGKTLSPKHGILRDRPVFDIRGLEVVA